MFPHDWGGGGMGVAKLSMVLQLRMKFKEKNRGGGSLAQYFAYLLLDQASRVRFPAFQNFFQRKKWTCTFPEIALSNHLMALTKSEQ